MRGQNGQTAGRRRAVGPWLAAVSMAIACGDDGGGDDDGAGTAAVTGTAGGTAVTGTADDGDDGDDEDDGDGDGDDGDDGDDTSGGDTSSGGGAGSTSASGDDAGSSEGGGSTDGDGGSEGESGSSGGAGARCGDGIVEGDEQCDELDLVDADGCNTDCTESGAVLWAHTQAGGFGNADTLHGIAVDEAGDAYVTGAVHEIAATTDFWLRRYAAAGGLGFTIAIDGSAAGNDVGLGIAQRDGELFAAGVRTQTGQGEDVFVRNLTTAGALGWSAGLDGGLAANDRGTSVAVDPLDGDVVVAGHTAVAKASDDVWVRAYSADAGGVLWTHTYGGAALGADRGHGVAVDSDGNAIVAGYETVAGAGLDGWVRRLDPDGDPVWTRSYAGAGTFDAEARAVAVALDDTIVVVGVEQTATVQQIWIRKYEPGGGELWTETWSGAEMLGAAAFGVAIDGTGDVVVVGSETAEDGLQALVRKYDEDGELRWSATIAGAGDGDHVASAVAIGPDQRIWIAGSADVGVDGADAWIARVAQ